MEAGEAPEAPDARVTALAGSASPGGRPRGTIDRLSTVATKR